MTLKMYLVLGVALSSTHHGFLYVKASFDSEREALKFVMSEGPNYPCTIVKMLDTQIKNIQL